jgi:hypothetical protein
VAAASSEGVEASETEIPCPEIYANCVVEGNICEENAATSDEKYSRTKIQYTTAFLDVSYFVTSLYGIHLFHQRIQNFIS